MTKDADTSETSITTELFNQCIELKEQINTTAHKFLKRAQKQNPDKNITLTRECFGNQVMFVQVMVGKKDHLPVSARYPVVTIDEDTEAIIATDGSIFPFSEERRISTVSLPIGNRRATLLPGLQSDPVVAELSDNLPIQQKITLSDGRIVEILFRTPEILTETKIAELIKKHRDILGNKILALQSLAKGLKQTLKGISDDEVLIKYFDGKTKHESETESE